MASIYFEHLPPCVHKKWKGILLLCACLIGGLLGSGALILFCTFLAPLHYLFAVLVMFLAAILYWLFLPYTDVEVEYCMAQDEFRIDKIYAQRFRRNVLTIETVDIFRILPLGQEPLPSEGVTDYSGGFGEDVYAVYYHEKELDCAQSRRVMLLHLSKERAQQFYLACPRATRR
jgi:hypothetical protein